MQFIGTIGRTAHVWHVSHLRQMIDRNFTNEKRIDELESDFESYIRWHRRSGIIVADSNIRLSFSLEAFSTSEVLFHGWTSQTLGIARLFSALDEQVGATS